MDASVARHCAEIDRCNQRGGRMLSVPDLLEAGTLDLDLAAFLMARITRGASFLVGARPGGAGKTTVMCALLNLIPAEVAIVAATPEAVKAAAHEAAAPRRCYVCHEIGSGPYFAYLWGRDLRAYGSLLGNGHILAANLHADDMDEAFHQICTQNGVPRAHFNGFNLLVFLRVAGGYRSASRRVEKVYASDGRSAHELVYDGKRLTPDSSAQDAWQRACRDFIDAHLNSSLRTIEETRERVVAFLESIRPE